MRALGTNPEIFTMNADGSNQINISNSPGMDASPSWSRTGDYIYISARDGNQEIYVMNGDGGNPLRLTTNNAYDDYPVIK